MRCDDDDDDDKVNKMLEKQTTTNDEESVCCTYCRTKRSQKQLQYSSHKMLNTLFANPCTHAHSIHTVHAYRCSKRARDVCIVNTNSHCFLFSRKYLCKGSSQLSLSLSPVWHGSGTNVLSACSCKRTECANIAIKYRIGTLCIISDII